MTHADFNITMNPYAFVEPEGGPPPEPDWEKLIQLLRSAEDYLRQNDEACDMDGSIAITEACSHLIEMLTEDFESEDERLRAFVRHTEWAAYWLAGIADDEQLSARLYRLCKRIDEIHAGMVAAGRAVFGSFDGTN